MKPNTPHTETYIDLGASLRRVVAVIAIIGILIGSTVYLTHRHCDGGCHASFVP
jgi:hypothetical protein